MRPARTTWEPPASSANGSDFQPTIHNFLGMIAVFASTRMGGAFWIWWRELPPVAPRCSSPERLVPARK